MDSDSPVAVRCRGVTKTYGAGETSMPALRGVDLVVRTGELLMLVGPSGCGKTTLLSVIASLLKRDSGTCEVMGRDLQTMAPRERARFRGKSFGFVFQSFNLLPALSAAENVAVPLLLNDVPRKQAAARANETLEKIGLGARAGARPAQLSGGQQQRVAIARALVHDPQLIICDEPTSALDHESGKNMMQLMRDVARGPGRALLVVTHDTRILDFADRIVRMEDGKVIDEAGRPAQGALQ